MCETHVETDMLIRTIEIDGAVLVTVDGSFESRTFRIPIEDAPLFAIADTLDCRAIVFRSDQGGGDLRALYPWLHGEWEVRYDLRSLCQDTPRPVVSMETVDEPLTDAEIDRNWTVVWEDE